MKGTWMLVSLLALAGCEISQPFGGPGYKDGKVTSDHKGKFLASSTHLDVSDDSESKETFDKHMEIIQKVLPKQKGLVGFSLSQVIGSNDEYRTLTVWESEEDMLVWVTSDEHLAAMDAMADHSDGGKVVAWDIDRDQIPPSWEEAKKRVDDDGHSAY